MVLAKACASGSTRRWNRRRHHGITGLTLQISAQPGVYADSTGRNPAYLNAPGRNECHSRLALVLLPPPSDCPPLTLVAMAAMSVTQTSGDELDD